MSRNVISETAGGHLTGPAKVLLVFRVLAASLNVGWLAPVLSDYRITATRNQWRSVWSIQAGRLVLAFGVCKS